MVMPEKVSGHESLVFMHWITILQLLKLGITWAEIEMFSPDEMSIILGIEAATNERQQEEQARQMVANKNNIRGY